MIHKIINKKYLDQWQKENIPCNYGEYYPFLYGPFPEDKECFKDYILFIGLNPALPKRYRMDYDINKQETRDNKYDWSSDVSEDKQHEISQFDEQQERRYSYFKKMWEIANEFGLDMEHMDMFSVRGTSAKDLIRCLDLEIDEKMESFRNGNGFRDEQLDIFFTTLLMLRPRVIVVANALASHIFHLKHKQYCFTLRYHEDFGYHLLSYSGREVPIFFSSMFSGQRALDRYSFQKLKWHIKFSLKQKRLVII